MAMRETVRSMKAYFIVVGLITGALGALNLVKVWPLLGLPLVGWLRVVLVGLPCISLAVSILLLYAAFTVRRQLEQGRPRRVQQAVLLSGVLYLATGLVRVLLVLRAPVSQGQLLGELLDPAIALVITWYLYVNARRLANEAVAARKLELDKTFS